MIFHVGCRRFSASPIFSAHTNGDKHKLERFLRNDCPIVATIYAPITFPPASVLVYKQDQKGNHNLIATGFLMSCDPDRIIIKRIVLSGHPFKINKKSAVIRYMFFNREDILWFKPVELRTKYGRRGHIKEPLGTHGHMKCTFEKQLRADDTVLMNLYKRAYPKWNYDPHVNPPTNQLNLEEEMNLDDIIKMHDEKECEKEEEEEMENSIVIKPSQAPDSINLIINFLQQKNSDLTEEISYAEKIKIKILKEKQTSQVQKSITDYFNSK